MVYYNYKMLLNMRLIGTFLKKLFLSPNKKVLAENFLSLSFLQVANYILPLVTLPYLVRVLGPATYGVVIFVTIIIEYCIIFSDYGFNFSASRKISVFRDDMKKIGDVFNNVFFVKLFLMLAVFLAVMCFVVLVPKLRAYWFLYIFASGTLVGRNIFPTWFFQGMERMKYTAILSILSKTIFTVLIFIVVRKETDYAYVIILNALGSMVAGILSLAIVRSHFGISIRRPSFTGMVEEIKEGWHLFVTVITYVVYSMGVPVILGLFTDYAAVGYYGAGEKIVRAIEQMLAPLQQSVYPHISKLASESRIAAVRFIRRLAEVMGSVTFLLSLLLFVFAPAICGIVLGRGFPGSVIVVRILSFVIFARSLGQVFLAQTMLNFGEDKDVFRIALVASLTSILSAIILSPIFREAGAAYAALIPEIIVLIASAIFSERKFHIFTNDRRQEVKE